MDGKYFHVTPVEEDKTTVTANVLGPPQGKGSLRQGRQSRASESQGPESCLHLPGQHRILQGTATQPDPRAVSPRPPAQLTTGPVLHLLPGSSRVQLGTEGGCPCQIPFIRS